MDFGFTKWNHVGCLAVNSNLRISLFKGIVFMKYFCEKLCLVE